ncbi:MAG TPA: iron chelate uptake ABC transporter family permease subunit, partial [Luteibacter sp.]|nr:iron chelate uptake ABC transporter family permease subunit [Luteibacter sp.]
RPERLQPWLIAMVALAVSAAVAVTGVIGFVGLVVPHLLRLAWGPDHRLLLPASALGGAILMIAADTLARTVVAPAELPIGVITALLGGPFFLWLLLQSRIGEERA